MHEKLLVIITISSCVIFGCSRNKPLDSKSDFNLLFTPFVIYEKNEWDIRKTALTRLDPNAEAKATFKSGKIKFIAVPNNVAYYPGLNRDEWIECFKKYTHSRFIPLGCLTKDQEYYDSVYAFAAKYNRHLYSLIHHANDHVR